MFLAVFLIALVAASTAAPTEPLVGGFRPVPPSVGGPIGVADVNADANSRSVLQGGNNVKPWLSAQPKLGGN